MNTEERDQLKQLIEERIVKVARKVANYEEMTQPIKPENSIGRVSRMDAINNKSVAEAALRRAKENLDALKAALDNVYDKDFGKCKGCGCRIPSGRLVLKPENPYCVKCAV